MELQKTLHTIFLKAPINRFDNFIIACQAWYSKPAHNLQELKSRENKKLKGDIFEEFCILYLTHCLDYMAWRLEDVPEEILNKLSLKITRGILIQNMAALCRAALYLLMDSIER
jgi:hypothetical protein